MFTVQKRMFGPSVFSYTKFCMEELPILTALNKKNSSTIYQTQSTGILSKLISLTQSKKSCSNVWKLIMKNGLPSKNLRNQIFWPNSKQTISQTSNPDYFRRILQHDTVTIKTLFCRIKMQSQIFPLHKAVLLTSNIVQNYKNKYRLSCHQKII